MIDDRSLCRHLHAARATQRTQPEPLLQLPLLCSLRNADSHASHLLACAHGSPSISLSLALIPKQHGVALHEARWR